MSDYAIFEFSGLPKSGKTTIIEIVARYFRRRGFNVDVHSDEGTYAAISKDEIGGLNVFLGCEASKYILETKYAKARLPTISLVDRGIFDRCIFSETLFRRGTISSGENTTVQSFFTTPRMTSAISRVFLFVASIEDVIDRERLHSLENVPGAVMNRDFLSSFREVSTELALSLSSYFNKIDLIDTSEMNGQIRDTAKSVAMMIERSLHADQFIDPNVSEQKYAFQGNTLVRDMEGVHTIGPYIHFDGDLEYHRYMDFLYHRKTPDKMTIDESIEICDIRSAHFDKVVDLELNSKILDGAINYLKEIYPNSTETNIVDFGCGTGLSANLLARYYDKAKILGIDPSPAAIEKCKENGIEAEVYNLGEDLPYNDKTFQIAIAIFVMHFDVAESDLAALRERISDDGKFVFNLYNQDPAIITKKLVGTGWTKPKIIETDAVPSNHILFVSDPS